MSDYRDRIIAKVIGKHPEVDILYHSPTLAAAECIEEAVNEVIHLLEMMGGGGTFSDTSGYVEVIRRHFGMVKP